MLQGLRRDYALAVEECAVATARIPQHGHPVFCDDLGVHTRHRIRGFTFNLHRTLRRSAKCDCGSVSGEDHPALYVPHRHTHFFIRRRRGHSATVSGHRAACNPFKVANAGALCL